MLQLQSGIDNEVVFDADSTKTLKQRLSYLYKAVSTEQLRSSSV